MSDCQNVFDHRLVRQSRQGKDRVLEREPRIVYLLRQAQLRAFALLEQALSAYGLTPTQYTVLSLADRPPPHLSSAQLARRAGVKAQTMNEAIGLLARRGLLDRTGSVDHGRVILISVSAKGHSLLRECADAVDALEDGFLAALYPSEQAALRNMLRRLLTGADIRL